MKKSVLIHTFAALAIAATLPLGASAATPKKKTAEKGSVEKALRQKALLRARLDGQLNGA